jgi:hypothetical protein
MVIIAYNLIFCGHGTQDECSFVSLRDVERAMIVFKYFYEKMDIFAPLIEEKQREEEEEEEEDSNDEGSDDEGMVKLMAVTTFSRPLPTCTCTCVYMYLCACTCTYTFVCQVIPACIRLNFYYHGM